MAAYWGVEDGMGYLVEDQRVLPEDELPDDFEQPVRAAAPIAAKKNANCFFINMLLI